MAVPKFVVKRIAKKVIKSVLKRETMGKYKKQVKAEVAAAQKEVDTNLDVDLTTLAKSQSTRKEIRNEAKRRKNATKSEITRETKGKFIPKKGGDNLHVKLTGPAAMGTGGGVKGDRGVFYGNIETAISDNTKVVGPLPRTESPLAKYKCSYNSKKKK